LARLSLIFVDAEQDAHCVFGGRLLGPGCFYNCAQPVANVNEDFDPPFPVWAQPIFYKEFCNFWTAEAAAGLPELRIDRLLEFCHFQSLENDKRFKNAGLGVPPKPQSKIFDDLAVVRGHESVPLIDADVLPGGGISFETQAVGRIQDFLDVRRVLLICSVWSSPHLDSSITRASDVTAFSFAVTVLVWCSSRNNQR
jgi:hypothetical protein